MEVTFKQVEIGEKPILKQLLQLYIHDFSEYIDTDVGADGLYSYKYLDSYWEEDERHSFFVLADGNYAGFIMINQDLKIGRTGYCISEFFIMRKYRNLGIGSLAARYAFNLFKGPWEVSMITINEPSTLFWHKVIDQYTEGQFQSISIEIKDLKRIILTFQT